MLHTLLTYPDGITANNVVYRYVQYDTLLFEHNG